MESSLRRLHDTDDGSMARSEQSRTQSIINHYEAEEEFIINRLCRKLEQLREEKIQLENILEAESENSVNRLFRELNALRSQQLQQQQQQQQNGSNGINHEVELSSHNLNNRDPKNPSTDVMLAALRRENEMLRNRLSDTERDYIRLSRLNDVYREELIDHRQKLGLSTDNLLGYAPEPLSQPIHRRRESSTSPVVSTHPLSRSFATPVAIPRPPSQIHRPQPVIPPTTSNTTSSGGSPSSSLPPSPFPFSPASSALISPQTGYNTNLTTPASAPMLSNIPPAPYQTIHQLTYPHVPPPSLSSSLGSPVSAFPASTAPSRRNSVRIAESGSLIRSRRNTGTDEHQRDAHSRASKASSGSGFAVFGIDEADDSEEPGPSVR